MKIKKPHKKTKTAHKMLLDAISKGNFQGKFIDIIDRRIRERKIAPKIHPESKQF